MANRHTIQDTKTRFDNLPVGSITKTDSRDFIDRKNQSPRILFASKIITLELSSDHNQQGAMMDAAHTETPEVTVSISLTRKQQGALYMQSLRQAKRIKELNAINDDLVKALREMAELAAQVDSWQSFPSEPIDRAMKALAKAGA
jgi:hypothetical protein